MTLSIFYELESVTQGFLPVGKVQACVLAIVKGLHHMHLSLTKICMSSSIQYLKTGYYVGMCSII